MFQRLKPWLLTILSAGMLILSFPRVEASFLAFFGLVPLMFVLDGRNPARAFRAAYLCGFLFFAGTLYWFFNTARWFSFVAVVGVLLLFLYLALYFGVFGVFYSLFSRRKPLFKLFLLPSVWVVLEFIRAYLFTGFDWASLGQTQYRNLIAIQIADITGMFGVSFLVVLVNIFVKEFIDVYFIRKTSEARKQLAVVTWVTAVMVAGTLGYGTLRLSLPEFSQEGKPALSIAVIQPNIPQERWWDDSSDLLIMAKQIALTKQAAAENPDLIIWPESSYPDYLWEDRQLFSHVEALVQRIRIPILLGSVLKEQENYYNSAILLTEKGDVANIYRKIHLVPFGEFLPFRRFIPLISEALDIGDFTPGKEKTVFVFPGAEGKKHAFSTLICFEDTVARLCRGSVQNGAKALVNITNDAWFGDTAAPFMHLQSAVFRAVENRRALVRAANTGLSCFVNPQGKITECVQGREDEDRKPTYVSGFAIQKVPFNETTTLYTKFGDVFAILCFGCILMGIAVGKRKREPVGGKTFK